MDQIMDQKENEEIRGIDVSHWNGKVNWKLVAGSGIRFAMIKCINEANQFDSEFKRNYEGCMEQGIFVGVYKYVIARDQKEAEKEVAALLNALKGKKITYGVWLDIEDKRLSDIPALSMIGIVDLMIGRLKQAGYTAGVYCSKHWYDRLFAPYEAAYLFWIARYPARDDGQVHPKLDPGVGVCWQYSSKGVIEGIDGKVDLNLARTDISRIKEERPMSIKQKILSFLIK